MVCWSSSKTQILWNFRSDIGLILSFLCNRWLRVLLDWKSLLGLLKAKFLVLNFSHCIHELPDDVICNIVVAQNSVCYCPEQLVLASELKSDLWETMHLESDSLYSVLRKLTWFHHGLGSKKVVSLIPQKI